jgi:hypothetical protein
VIPGPEVSTVPKLTTAHDEPILPTSHPQNLFYYYLFIAIGFAPGGSGPYTTQLQQNTYNKNKYIP